MGMIADEFLGHGAALESNFAEAYHSRNRSGTGAGTMSNEDVPSPIDFHDLAQAKKWEAQTVKNRPWRPQFFAAFVAALQGHFDREFSVLELGSGPGHLAEQILRHCAIGRYVALDFSEPMHALARARLAALAGKVKFLQ